MSVGRRKKYERNEVLRKAMSLFWSKGFAGTGLLDLVNATGVKKSGLYAEFKDKDDIFVSSLVFYNQNRNTIKLLSAEPLGWDNIENYLKSITCGWEGNTGCFAVNSLRELDILPAGVNDILLLVREHMKQEFLKNIAAAEPDASPESLADIVFTFFTGLNIEQNFKNSRDAPISSIEDFIGILRAL